MTTPPSGEAQLPQVLNAYHNFFEKGGELIKQGKLAARDAQVFVSKQYQYLKDNDALLLPVVVVAAAIALLFFNILGTLFFFSCGTLYAIAKGSRLNDGVGVITNIWNDSQVGKIALIAAFVFIVAPQRWNVAAFGLGMFMAHFLKERT